MVAFNVRSLHDRKFVYAKIPSYKDGRNGLKCWPVTLREKGVDYLSAVRDGVCQIETLEQLK